MNSPTDTKVFYWGLYTQQPTQEEVFIRCGSSKTNGVIRTSFKSPNFKHVHSIKSFAFSNLYTRTLQQKLKNRLGSTVFSVILFTFFCVFKNGNRRYKYAIKKHIMQRKILDSKIKYSKDDITRILDFLVDNFFVVFAEKVFQQTQSTFQWIQRTSGHN